MVSAPLPTPLVFPNCFHISLNRPKFPLIFVGKSYIVEIKYAGLILFEFQQVGIYFIDWFGTKKSAVQIRSPRPLLYEGIYVVAIILP